MTSQDAGGIPFSASRELQSFKLLELPPELVQLLESDNPPTLYLKSATPVSSTAPAHAILCTPDTIYRIQQKNSSNPIMILEPCTSAVFHTDDLESNISCPAVRRIATIDDTLELYHQEINSLAPVPAKVNKWHEKFAKGRLPSKGKE